MLSKLVVLIKGAYFRGSTYIRRSPNFELLFSASAKFKTILEYIGMHMGLDCFFAITLHFLLGGGVAYMCFRRGVRLTFETLRYTILSVAAFCSSHQ